MRVRQYMSILFTVLFFFSPLTAVAQTLPLQSTEEQTLPDNEGIYNVPNHPNLKLRVFIHKQRVEKSASTINTKQIPVCGLSDPDSTAVVNGAGWHMPNGTWTYRLNTGNVPGSVGSKNFPTISANAFTAWSATSVGTKVTFVRGANTTMRRAALDGKNIIAWGATPNTALAVSYIWFDGATGTLAEVDTIYNKNVPWAWSDGTTCAISGFYDAQDILTHELGHWMGLDDKYDISYTDNTMYGYGSVTEVKKDTLTTGDKAGISLIYP